MNPKPKLSWRAAMRIAWREVRASRAKFVFVVLSVAIGVGSLTGVRGFSTSFRHMLLGQARTLMAGDLTARVFALPTAEQEAALRGLEARGVRRTWITETVTMASSASTPDPLLISVKAVDPRRLSLLRCGEAESAASPARGAGCPGGGGLRRPSRPAQRAHRRPAAHRRAGFPQRGRDGVGTGSHDRQLERRAAGDDLAPGLGPHGADHPGQPRGRALPL